jgi:hypothetical protein
MRKIISQVALILFLIGFINNNLFAQNTSEGLYLGSKENKELNCNLIVKCENLDLNLGTFYNGYIGNEIPAPDGNGNSIYYAIIGSNENSYNVEGEFFIFNNDNNSIQITSWEWEIQDDENSENLETTAKDQYRISKNVKLKKIGKNDCESIAKVSLKINSLKIAPDAIAQSYTIIVSLSVIEGN